MCVSPAPLSPSGPTGQRVDELGGLHVVEVGGAVPGRRHHLPPAHQPVGGDHHPLVGAQRGGGHAHARALAWPLPLAVRLLPVRQLPVLLVGRRLLLLLGGGGGTLLMGVTATGGGEGE